jgi:poly-beta-1,6-N-acetyl-D-glucosamine synthase
LDSTSFAEEWSVTEPGLCLWPRCDGRSYLGPNERPQGLFVGVPPMGPYLVGRESWIESLAARLTGKPPRCVTLTGTAGVGKTMVAAALAHRRDVNEAFSGGILWAHLGRPEHADPMWILGHWATALGIDVSQVSDMNERSQRVREAIGSQRLLLVIDDVRHPDLVRVLRCGGPNCSYLLTTREPEIAYHLAGPEETLHLTELDDDEAFSLLRLWAPEACAADPGAAYALAQAVGGLPLSLELLGSYLRAPEERLFTNLSEDQCENVGDPEQRLACARQSMQAYGGTLSLQATIGLNLESLPPESVAAFYALSDTGSPSDQAAAYDATAIGKSDLVTSVILAARNLVQIEGGALRLRGGVADVARQVNGQDRGSSPLVKCTIGIMAYNEAANIGRLLDALLKQETEMARIEHIVVVASGCTDGTEEIVKGFMARDPRIRLLCQPEREGKASAVNLFMAHARAAEVIVLSSADLLPGPGTIEALISPFASPAIGMVGAHPIPTNPCTTFLGFGINLLWRLHHQVSLQYPKMGELIAFRNIFRQIPRETAVDEASIEPLIVGQGLQLHYAPDAIVYNHGPENVRDFIKQRRRIYTGHLYVKDTLGYQVSTMKGTRILRALLRSLEPSWSSLIWAPAIVALEIFVRALGIYDYRVRKHNPFVWQMAESTKKDLVTN